MATYLVCPVVLVCGGRDFSDWQLVDKTLDDFAPKAVIHGGARGADSLAAEWAARTGCPARCYPADWKAHGRAAGPIRNQEMLDNEPDVALVIAFPGGKGTADMVRRAQQRGIPVHFVSASLGGRG